VVEPGLSGRATKAALWQVFSYGLSKVVVLVTTVVLARLLTPRAFGLFALALIFITYSENLTDLGVAQALIYFPRARKYDDAALAISILVSLFLAGIIFTAADSIAAFFGVDGARPLIQFLSLSLLLRGTGNLPDALLRKELLFRRRVVAEGLRAVTMGTVSIVLATRGLGVWAIVVGYVVGDLAWNVSSWILSDYRPGIRFWRLDYSASKAIASYGAPAALQGSLQALVHDIDYLIIGRILGSVPLGFYTVGFRIPQSTIVPLFWAVSAVSFPAYSKVQDDEERLRRGYLGQMRALMPAGVGGGAGLAVLAPVLVPVLFGPRWIPSVTVLQILAFYAALRGFTSGIAGLYKGIGRPRMALGLTFLRLIVVVPAVIVGTRWGIEGVAWSQVLTTLVVGSAMQILVGRTLSLSPGKQLRQMVPGVAVGVGVAVGASVAYVVPLADWLRLLAGLGGATIVGALSLNVCDRSFVVELLATLRGRGKLQQDKQ